MPKTQAENPLPLVASNLDSFAPDVTVPTYDRMGLRPGIVQTGPAGYIHAVNHQSGAPAVTLHAYSPPLLQVGQYRAGPGGALLREQQHGRQELLDHTIAGERISG